MKPEVKVKVSETIQDRRSRIADFARGYFIFLEERGIMAAVLHGWEDAFEGEISDIDHVVSRDSFPSIGSTIAAYCSRQGWRLCQMLWHENTAVFCVCSAVDDPDCVVALDACSDYRRNGRELISAHELLQGRMILPWGGYRLSPQHELRYRFMKAAAKAKLPEDVFSGFLTFDEICREEFRVFLWEAWNVRLEEWTLPALTVALEDLRKICGPKGGQFQLSDFPRLLRRTLRPDGLLVVAPSGSRVDTDSLMAGLSHLYFRRTKAVRIVGLRERFDLVRSTLVVSANAPFWVTLGLGRRSVVLLSGSESAVDLIEKVVGRLHQRVMRRLDLEEG